MSLLQISDPKQTKDKLKKFVVGIDLGTTNSLIAMRNTTTKFYIENKSTMIPSIVNFHPDGRISIGKSSISDAFLGNDAGEISIGENENFSVEAFPINGRAKNIHNLNMIKESIKYSMKSVSKRLENT